MHKCPTYFFKQKAIHIISNAKYNHHASKLIHNLIILTIFQQVKLQTCMIVYKAFSNKLPLNIQSYSAINLSGNEYRTRQENILRQKYTQATKRLYCLSNIGVNVWNNLNENRKSCDNLSSFMRVLKDHIMN